MLWRHVWVCLNCALCTVHSVHCAPAMQTKFWSDVKRFFLPSTWWQNLHPSCRFAHPQWGKRTCQKLPEGSGKSRNKSQQIRCHVGFTLESALWTYPPAVMDWKKQLVSTFLALSWAKLWKTWAEAVFIRPAAASMVERLVAWKRATWCLQYSQIFFVDSRCCIFGVLPSCGNFCVGRCWRSAFNYWASTVTSRNSCLMFDKLTFLFRFWQMPSFQMYQSHV